MSWLGLATALLLPWAVGTAWLRLGWPGRPAGAWAVRLGYGYVLGMLGTTLLMRLVDAAGLPLRFPIIVALLLGLLLLGLRMGGTLPWRRAPAAVGEELSGWREALLALLLALLAVRLAGLAMEVYWRPLYPWDAWASWGQRAIVWFHAHALLPFVSKTAWLEAGRTDVYTSGAYWYPPSVPLIQMWVAQGLGQWDDALVNLPWAQCAAALGLACYGQLRLAGGSVLLAVGATYLLLSLPVLDTHVALAGYADLWMAASYGLAAMAFMQWLHSGERRQGAWALLFALLGTQVKQEGLVWMFSFLPALGVVRLGRRAWMAITAVLSIAMLLLWLVGGLDLRLPGGAHLAASFGRLEIPGLPAVALGYHPVWEELTRYLFVYGSWHLFWYLWPLLLVIALPRAVADKAARASLVQVATALGLVLFMFLFTDIYRWVKEGTAVNRILLQLVPGLMFFGVHAARMLPGRFGAGAPVSPARCSQSAR